MEPPAGLIVLGAGLVAVRVVLGRLQSFDRRVYDAGVSVPRSSPLSGTIIVSFSQHTVRCAGAGSLVQWPRDKTTLLRRTSKALGRRRSFLRRFEGARIPTPMPCSPAPHATWLPVTYALDRNAQPAKALELCAAADRDARQQAAERETCSRRSAVRFCTPPAVVTPDYPHPTARSRDISPVAPVGDGSLSIPVCSRSSRSCITRHNRDRVRSTEISVLPYGRKLRMARRRIALDYRAARKAGPAALTRTARARFKDCLGLH